MRVYEAASLRFYFVFIFIFGVLGAIFPSVWVNFVEYKFYSI